MTRAGRRTIVVLLAAAVVSLLLLPSAEAAKKKKRRSSASKSAPAAATFDAKLPVLGTHLSELPAGAAKVVADQACLSCHSADMVWQQKLTEKQWSAEITKMVNWGAPVPEARRAELLEYLVKNFGPENDRFQPVITRPVGK